LDVGQKGLAVDAIAEGDEPAFAVATDRVTGDVNVAGDLFAEGRVLEEGQPGRRSSAAACLLLRGRPAALELRSTSTIF
jgi:hypothetical protein